MHYRLWIAMLVLSSGLVSSVYAQDAAWPDPPSFSPYKGKPGKVVKYNTFNYLDIRDESGENLRHAMGKYWEISYTYDSVFRQKRKFREFVANQVIEKEGHLFFEDTTQVHFFVPDEGGNVWGRLVLASDKVYRLRLIREERLTNTLHFDTKPDVRYERFVDTVQLPPRVTYLPSSWITRIQSSKFNHQEFTWNQKDTLYKQKVMGPYWDIKLEVRNSRGEVDKTMSTVELMESYYRACVQVGGTIIKNRPRELVFTLPMEHAALWCRVSASLDGVYFIRAILMDDRDRTEPVKTVTIPPVYPDSMGNDPVGTVTGNN